MDDTSIIFIFAYIVCVIIAAIIGDYKKCGAGVGFILGLFFSIIGIVIVACLPDKETVVKDSGLTTPPAQQSKIDELEKFFKLYQSGGLTQEEFEIQKKRLLS